MKIVLSILFAFCMTAASQDKKQTQQDAKAKIAGLIDIIFKDSDKNKDHKFSKKELTFFKRKTTDFFVKLFTVISEDSNGKKEVKQPPMKQIEDHVEKMVKAVDLDKNGELSKKEVQTLRKVLEKMVLQ